MPLPDDSPWNLLPDKLAPSVSVLLQESAGSSGLSQALKSANLERIASLAGLGGVSKRTSADLARDLLKDRPELAVRYLALKRDMEIQQSILGLLKQQLELVRLEELNTTTMFQIVDAAEVPEKRAEPRRSLIGVVAAFAGACLGIFAAAQHRPHALLGPDSRPSAPPPML